MATAILVEGAKPYDVANFVAGEYAIVRWDLTTADPTGTGVNYRDYADRSVQVVSAAFGGATVAIEGSLDGGTTWSALTDPQGVAITFAALGAVKALVEAVPLIRARLSTVGAAAVISVYLYVRKVAGK